MPAKRKPRVRKVMAVLIQPQPIDPNSDLYRAALNITHQHCGSERLVCLDVTERVARALVEAAKTGRLPDVPATLGQPLKRGANVRHERFAWGAFT